MGVTARHSNRFRVSVNTSPHRLIDNNDLNYDDGNDHNYDDDQYDDDGVDPKAISPMKYNFSIVTFYLLYEELLGRRGGTFIYPISY